MTKLKAFLLQDAGELFAPVGVGLSIVAAWAVWAFVLIPSFLGEVVSSHTWVTIVTATFALVFWNVGPRGSGYEIFILESARSALPHRSRASIQLATLGGEIGAMGLPEFLTRHGVFGNANGDVFFVDTVIPSIARCFLTFSTVSGALCGTCLVGWLCGRVDVKWPDPAERSQRNGRGKVLELWSEVWFAWLRYAPLAWLLLSGTVHEHSNPEARMRIGLGFIALGLLWCGTCFDLGPSVFRAVCSAQPPQFLPALCHLCWAFGAVIAGWLGVVSIPLSPFRQLQVVYQPMMEGILWLTWSLQGLCGACLLSNLAVWGVMHSEKMHPGTWKKLANFWNLLRVYSWLTLFVLVLILCFAAFALLLHQQITQLLKAW